MSYLLQYQIKAEPVAFGLPGASLNPIHQPADITVNIRAATVAAAFMAVASTTVFAAPPNPTPYGTVVKIDHEEGDLSDYDSTVNPGDLSISQPGLAVTDNRLKVTLNDTDDHYGAKAVDWRTDDLRVGLNLDMGKLDYGDPTDDFQVWSLRDGSGATRVALYLANDPSVRVFWASVIEDDLTIRSLPLTETLDLTHIEVVVKRATSASAADGTFEMYVDGVLKQSLTNLQLFTLNRPSELRVGVQDSNGTFSGSMALDEICVRDDTTPIERMSNLSWLTQCDPPLWGAYQRVLHPALAMTRNSTHTPVGPPTEVWYVRDITWTGSDCVSFTSPDLTLLETAGSVPTSDNIGKRLSASREETIARSVPAGPWTFKAHLSGAAANVRVRVRRFNSACTLQQQMLDQTIAFAGGAAQEVQFTNLSVPRVDFNAGDILVVTVKGGSFGVNVLLHHEGTGGFLSSSNLVHPAEVSEIDFDWLPSYPDQISRKPHLVPEALTTASLETSLFEVIDFPAWLPTYPDMVRGTQPLVLEGFWAGVLDDTLFDALAFDWGPTYPDTVPGLIALIPEGLWTGVLEASVIEPQDLSWIPETNQPVRRIPAILDWEGWIANRNLVIPTVDFSDLLPTNQPPRGFAPLTQQDWWAGVLEASVVEPRNLDWITAPNQPPAGLAPAPPQDYWTGILDPAQMRDHNLGWLPEPNQPPRGPVPLIHSDWWAGILADSIAAEQNLDWMTAPNQPPPGRTPLVAEGFWTGILNTGLFEVQDLSWLPETNRPPNSYLPLTWHEYWVGVLEPTTVIEPPFRLAWLPDYPVFVRGRFPVLAEGLWVGVLEPGLFPALPSTSYYTHLIMIRRRSV